MLHQAFLFIALAASTMAAPSPDAAATATCPSYSKMVLDNHNTHRANHSAPALAYSATVAEHAAEWARKCNFSHNTTYGEGQNLAVGNQPARYGISSWYNTEVNNFNGQYGAASPDTSKFESYGHFSQVVWKSTTSVGCATQSCPGLLGIPDAYYTVCNYYPPGNYFGEFNTNVLQPKGAPIQGAVC